MTRRISTVVEHQEPGDPTDGPSPAAPSSRRADIQGLRAVAVLMVVAFHAGFSVPGGYTGVDVFFVISGFVITAMLLRELTGSGRLSFAGFYARRVRRILPASALAISAVALASVLAINPSAQKLTARTGITGSLFVANIMLARGNTGYFDVAPTSNPLLHIWSLSVEEQFYLAFPALLVIGFILARRRFPNTEPRRVVGAIVGGVAVVSFIVSWYATFHTSTVAGVGINAQLAFYLAPTRAWEFAVGALLAIAVPHINRLPRGLAVWSGIAGAALVGAAAFGLSGTTPFPGTAALLPVSGTALLVVAGTIGTNHVSRALSVRPMTRIGDLSYSWYLWHWPLIVFTSALFPMEDHAAWIGAAISVVPAWLSFKYLETPVRLDTRVRGRRALMVAAVCIIVPALCSFFLLHAPKPSASAATKALLTASAQSHASESHRCNLGVPFAALPPRCSYPVARARGRVVLLGDSNAGHFVEPAGRAANALGYDLVFGTYPDCPFVDLVVSNAIRPASTLRCRTFVAKSLGQLIVEKPDLVLLAASGPLYLTSDTMFRDPNTGQTATTPAGKAALWSIGLTRVLQRLHDAGIPTVVIHTVPQWKTWDLRSCAEVRVYVAPRSCGSTQSRAEVASFRRRSIAADNRALAAVPGTVGVDFLSDLCPADGCATNRQNLWLYKDGRHLSVAGALQLTNQFEAIMRANVRHAPRRAI